METHRPLLPSLPEPMKLVRTLMPPEDDGRACLYITAHALKRMEQRFGVKTLSQTPFKIHTHYCEADDIDRPTWAIEIGNYRRNGYILGRWELADPNLARGVYKHWFVGTTAITQGQFDYSHLHIMRSVEVQVVRVRIERIPESILTTVTN